MVFQLMRRSGCCAAQSDCQRSEGGLHTLKDRPSPWQVSVCASRNGSAASVCIYASSGDMITGELLRLRLWLLSGHQHIPAGPPHHHFTHNRWLFLLIRRQPRKAECENSPSLSDADMLPSSLKDDRTSICQKDSCSDNQPNSPWLINDLNIPTKTKLPDAEDESRLGNGSLKLQPPPQGNSERSGQVEAQEEVPDMTPAGHQDTAVVMRCLFVPVAAYSPPTQGPIAEWIASQREEIVAQMTEACLNQSLDALLARSMLMREDYELVKNQQTRTAKVRQLLDNCHRHNEDFCRIVVRKLHDNKQMNLAPYPSEITSPALASAPPVSMSYNITRNM